jgi:KUP system potassium uptake protein
MLVAVALVTSRLATRLKARESEALSQAEASGEAAELSALLHNLKHNKVLHRTNVLLKVENAEAPHIEPAERLRLEPLDERFIRAWLTYGYMDAIDVPSDLARNAALLTGKGGTSFYVGRSTIRRELKPQLPRWIALIYSFLHRNAADPTAYFAIPPNRVVELGSQLEL